MGAARVRKACEERNHRSGRGWGAAGTALRALCALALLWAPAGALAATITVDTTDDEGGASDCSLRSAIQAANTDTAIDGCTAGSGADTIDLTGVSGTISLGSPLPNIAQSVTITGPGAATLAIDGNDLNRSGFYVHSAITVAVSGLTMTRGLNHGASDDYSGGAVYNHGGTVTVEDCAFTSNAATGGSELRAGGAIFNNNGTLTVTGSTFTGNTAELYGGAIRSYNDASGTLTLADSTLHDNTSNDGMGGGLSLSGGTEHTVVNCTLSGNTVSSASMDGGGLYNGPSTSLEIRNSTISGNTSARRGGGIKNEGTLTLYNCTVSGNGSTADGGGIQTSSGTVTLVNATVSGNTAGGSGGGIKIVGGTVSLKNTILADNTAGSGPDCSGTLTSQDYNLLGDNTTCTMSNAGHDQIGTGGSPIDPLLGDLGDYGGSTQTLPLCTAGQSDAGCGSPASDSPALNYIPQADNRCGTCAPPADDCAYSHDQRNATRPYSTSCDIGAYERTGATLVELVSFTAACSASGVELAWETASETDSAGFRLWRAEASDGPYQLVTEGLVPARGGPSQGATYTHEDVPAELGRFYWYRLEDVDSSGAGVFHGPVLAAAGCDQPWSAAPADASTLPGRARAFTLSRPGNALLFALLPAALVLAWRGLRRRR